MTFDFGACWTCEGKLSRAKMEWIQSARSSLPAPFQLSQCLGHAMHKRKARSNIEIMDIGNLEQAFSGFDTQTSFTGVEREVNSIPEKKRSEPIKKSRR